MIHFSFCSGPARFSAGGRVGSTVPFDFAVSGAPSPFLLLSGSFAMSVECFVSVFDSPSCLPDCVDMSPGVFAVAG